MCSSAVQLTNSTVSGGERQRYTVPLSKFRSPSGSVIEHEDQGRRVKVVRAVTDGLNALRKYRADSRSHFLFFVVRGQRDMASASRDLTCPTFPPSRNQNGEQVAVVDGPVLPRIMALIRQHAQHVLDILQRFWMLPKI